VLFSSWGKSGFEEVVEGEEEFSHDGGQSEFVRFSLGAQTLIKVGKDLVMTSGGQPRHVEATAESAPSTEDGAFAW